MCIVENQKQISKNTIPFSCSLEASSIHDYHFRFFDAYMYLHVYHAVTQLCPALCNCMDCGLPGSSVPEILRQEYWSESPFPTPYMYLSVYIYIYTHTYIYMYIYNTRV